MKHKYLCELFPEDELPFPYCEPDYPDFDERSTFNMDYTLIAWLYECLRYFQDEASKVVDLDWQGQLFEIDDEYLTQRQCIDRMVDDCKVILLEDEFEDREKRDAAKDDIFKVLSKVYWMMWW